MAHDDDTDQGGKQVIARVASILDALAHEPSGMSLGQIAAKADLPRSTVQRIVRALEVQGLAVGGRGGVKLGPTITRLAASAHVDLVSAGAPFIEAAGRRTRETVDLSIFRGIYALLVHQYPSDQELRVISPVGAALPIHCTAHGKALLAEMSDSEVRSLLAGPLESRTENSITDIDRLLADLSDARKNGFAIDREEHAPGVCGIGVAIKSASGERYALSIAVPSIRFDEAFTDVKSAILKARAEIEEAVGSTHR